MRTAYDRIKSRAEELGKTIAGVEKELGASNGSLGKFKGKNNSTIERYIQIAKLLNTSLDYLVGLNDEPDIMDRFHQGMSFEAYLNSLGWTVSLTDYAKDMSCEKCGQEIELTEEEKELYPFGKNAPKLCKHCLRDDNHYIISNGSISVNVSKEDFADFEADVRTMCVNRIREFINESVKTSLAAARPSITPLSDEDGDADMLNKK